MGSAPVNTDVMPLNQSMPKTKEGIELIPCEAADVRALLGNPLLEQIESRIADSLRIKIRKEHSSSDIAHHQANISVSGMTCGEIERLLASNGEEIRKLAILILSARHDDTDNGEFAVGEEQETGIEPASEEFLQSGFAIGYAITLNFLRNRTKEEHMAYLKNRRVPRAAAWVKDLRTYLDEIDKA